MEIQIQLDDPELESCIEMDAYEKYAELFEYEDSFTTIEKFRKKKFKNNSDDKNYN